jgi:hypothetical protein
MLKEKQAHTKPLANRRERLKNAVRKTVEKLKT